MLREGSLATTRQLTDTMVAGRVHERLVQRYEGLPVFGSGVVRQREGDTIRSVFGEVYEGIAVPTDPQVSAPEAIAAAAAAVSPTAFNFEPAAVGILPLWDQYFLAWRVPIRSSRSIDDVFVDAMTGTVLRRRSRIRTQLADIGLGRGVFGDDKKMPARSGPSGYEAHDALRPAAGETFDFGGSPAKLDAFFRTGLLATADLARDADNTWDDGAVVDAHVYQGFAYDYFFKQFGRHGMDDGDGAVRLVAHPLSRADIAQYDDELIDLFINNAIYLQGTRFLMFGDGDGRVFDRFAGALDIVAHEWAHGVTAYGADLTYEDEPGALNESFSDIMGAAAEFFFQEAGSGPRTADWVLGEDALVGGGFFRSMSNPAAAGDPDHYSLLRFIGTDIDNGGIHINSGIPNHAFYLAVAGGQNRVSRVTVQGIGIENMARMERIFYRAFVYFLSPSSRFTHARAATLAAAAELYGSSSNEFTQLQQAWTAVGVQ
jgi:thermolysin